MIRKVLSLFSSPRQEISFHVSEWASRGEPPIATNAAAKRSEFEAKFRKLMHIAPESSIAWVGSGRSALRLALAAFQRAEPNRKKVVVPTYCCSALIPSILDNGLVPKFIDTTEELISSSAQYKSAVDSDVLAVIVVNLCGRRLSPLDTDDIVQFCKANGVFVVEDNCQDIKSHHSAQSFDFSFYSFGFAKPIRATAGGALVYSQSHNLIEAELDTYAEQSDAAPLTRLRYYAAKYVRLRRENPISEEEFAQARTEYGRVRMSEVDFVLANESIDRLDDAMGKVRNNSLAILDAIKRNRRQADLFSAKFPKDNTFVRMPLVLSSPEVASNFWSFMNGRAIELEGMYKPLHLTYSGVSDGSLRVSEKIYQNVYNIPNRDDLSKRDLRRIYNSLREFGHRKH